MSDSRTGLMLCPMTCTCEGKPRLTLGTDVNATVWVVCPVCGPQVPAVPFLETIPGLKAVAERARLRATTRTN